MNLLIKFEKTLYIIYEEDILGIAPLGCPLQVLYHFLSTY